MRSSEINPAPRKNLAGMLRDVWPQLQATGEVRGLGVFENLVDVDRGSPIQINQASAPYRQEAPSSTKSLTMYTVRQPVPPQDPRAVVAR